MGTVLSRFHNMPKGTLVYPSVCVDHEFPEELPVLMDAMKDGDLPVVIEHQGSMIMLEKKISRSPLSLEKLLRVYPIILMLGENNMVRVTTIEELLDAEGIEWTPSL